MSGVRAKQPRLRLDAEAYDRLCWEILKRDCWRCQSCGSMQNLQVHHQRFRSQSGNDTEENLITLCDRCHDDEHHGRKREYPLGME